MTRPNDSLLLGADGVCLGILVADVIARPIDASPETGTLALVDSITLRGGGCALNTPW
jgi:sugar/nucleoside kinase (ribokinase family)